MDLHIEDFQVADLIDEVLATVRPLVAANGNSLNLEIAADLGAMRTDRVKVKQNLYNLLSNATKFTKMRRSGSRSRTKMKTGSSSASAIKESA